MKPMPMTVAEMCAELDKQPGSAYLAWVDKNGTVGYFYHGDQEMAVDDGHVYIEIGPAR